MATLADAGQKTTNENNPYSYATPKTTENNPYSQALQGGANDETFRSSGQQTAPNPGYEPSQLGKAGLKYQSEVEANQGSGTAQLGPASVNYLNNKAAGRTSYASALEHGGNAADADQSVADTPEAASPADAAKQQAAANAAQLAKDKASKTGAAKPILPTAQQNINAALAPDQAILDALPAEYQSTMSALAPYIGGGQSTGNAALDAADKAVASSVGNTDNSVMAGLTALGKDSKEYAKSVSTQPIIQALLGFGKYEETYAGAQPTGQSDWSNQMKEIYKYLAGTNASSNGLGSPQSAAATAGSGSTVPTDSGAGGGNGY